MSNSNRKLQCPKCGDIFLSFSKLCDHVEHVHGMWYLKNKNSGLTSDISASHETRRVPTSHADSNRLRISSSSNSKLHRIQDTQPKFNVEAAIHKLNESCSRLEGDVKLIFQELRKKNDFLKEQKGFRYSSINNARTSPTVYDNSGGKEISRLGTQFHPLSVESKTFDRVSPIHFVGEKGIPTDSVVSSSFGDGVVPFQMLKVPNKYRHKNASCPFCRTNGVCSFDPESTLISHLRLNSKLSHKFDHGTFSPFLSPGSVVAHDGQCLIGENTLCKQLFCQESHADSGKGDSVKSKATSAKVNGGHFYPEENTLCKQLRFPQQSHADSEKEDRIKSKATSAKAIETVESRPFPLETRHSSRRHSLELNDGFSKKQCLSSGELLQENFFNLSITGESPNPLELVFFYLNTNDLLTCRMVCRSWRQIAQQSRYYENVVISERIATSELLLSVAESCCFTKFLTLKDLRGRDKKDGETTDEYLRRMRGVLEIGLEAILKSSEDTLISLSIVSCGNLLTERCLWLASCYSRELTQIAYISQLHPASAESLWAFGSGCRKVQTLIIPPLYPSPQPERFSSRSLHMVAKCWPNLRTLCVGGTEVGTDGLVSIASNCHRLEVLELDHMGEVQESAIITICRAGLKGLRRIYFTHTPVTPDALLHLYSVCTHLTLICVILDASDYFINPKHPPNIREFERKISAIKDLLDQPGFPDVLRITVK